MEINVVYNKNLNVGDVIHAVGGSGVYYIIAQTRDKKYVLLDLKSCEISSIEYDSITDMIKKFFGGIEIKVISSDNLQLTIRYY